MIDPTSKGKQSGPKTTNLSPIQREAVEHGEGPLLIGAGAGSGKTRTLTQRVIHLIREGVPPERILAITFTNKAADEIKRRIYAELPKEATDHLPFLGTFHSFGARILREEAKTLGRTARFTIFDNNDSLRVIKKVLVRLNMNALRHTANKTERMISKTKSELMGLDDLNEEDAATFTAYEAELRENNAFDFDDLIEKPVRLFQSNPQILERHRERYSYILVDEFQDVNRTEYILVKFLAANHRNLNVVGDDQQCVPPGTKINTVNGLKNIEKITLKDRVIAASGNGDICTAKILKIKKMKYRGTLVKITTQSNKIIRLTPNHLIFTRLQLLPDIHFVYLMYRKDKGFRIGIVKGARKGRDGDQIGSLVRSSQEKADKIWVLKVCPNRTEAEYYEFFYAFKYGIPTVVFDTYDRNMKLTQHQIDRLYQNIDTKSRALKLMKAELLYFSYPHSIPQGTVRHRSARLRVRITLFDDRRKSKIRPWGMSRLSINTKDRILKKEIEKLGLITRRGKLNDWRLEIAKLQYKEIEGIASKLENLNTNVEFVRSACLVKGKRLFFQPASHARLGMKTAILLKGREITTDVIKKMETEPYNGFVYDLDVENVHNYIANDLVVHNSIYGFRGADFKNFLDFEKDWPNTKVVNLGENYRSSGSIVKASYGVIKNNKFQRPKELWTSNDDGAPIRIIATDDAEDEAERVVSEISVSHPASREIAILYRTNAQSRALEGALSLAGIPYDIFGGLKFYDRKEVKDIVSAVRYALNPKDFVSLERLQKTFRKAVAKELEENLPRLGDELELLELIGFFMKTTDYPTYLNDKFDNVEDRLENVKELLNFAGTFSDASEFLERITLLQDADRPAKNISGKGVKLMTIHMAKGLEFDKVFIVGATEGIIPHQRSLSTPEEIEEERRLMYVAMTRARQELVISFYGMASRFLYEIPPELVEFDGPQQWTGNGDVYI